MSGTLPEWLTRLLEVEAADSGQGTRWRLEHAFPWPAWVTLLFVLLAGGLVLAAYFSETGTAKRRTRIALAATRLATIALVLLMLAGWMMALERTDLPYVVVMVDVSRSMQTVDRFDDARPRSAVERRLRAMNLDQPSRIHLARLLLLENDARLLDAIGKKYKVKLYFVAEGAQAAPEQRAELLPRLRTVEADGESTRLGDAVSQVLEQLRGSPVAAIVLLSDGITTEGRTLVEVADECRRRGTPLLTIALGSDTPPRDVELRDLAVSEVVFGDQLVEFQARLTASGFAGRRIEVTLRESSDPAILARTAVLVESDSHGELVRLHHRPTEVGDYVYVVEAQPLPEEIDRANNAQTAPVSVRDRMRVLLVQAEPSYEFRYLKHLLERDRTVEVTTVLQDADLEFADIDESAVRVFPVRREDLLRYDVIVLGDANPAFLSQSAMENVRDFVRQSGGGVAVVAGPRYSPLAWRETPLEELLPIDLAEAGDPRGDGRTFDEGFQLVPTEMGLASPIMRLGDTPEETARAWSELPSMYWFFEAPRLRRGAQVLAEHPTETTADGRSLPLISMQYVGSGQVLFHAVDSTYLWRGHGEDSHFARYWMQAMRTLARAKLLGSRRRVELTTDRSTYRRGSPVRIRVRFLDEQQAPAGDDETAVGVVLERRDTGPHPVTLARHPAVPGLYEALVGQLSEGEYTVRMVVPHVEGVPPSARFSIDAPLGELERLEADFTEMSEAARLSGGHAYRFETADRLLADLPDGHPVPIGQLPPVPLWNRWPVPLLFVLLLVTEWLLRKRHGMV